MSPRRNRWTRAVVAAAVGLAPVAYGVSTAGASTQPVRVGSVPVLPARAQSLGSVTPSQTIDLTIALRPQDPSAMAAMATAVSSPQSLLYRHYLTAAQFAQRFGATDQSVTAVARGLRAAGLNVGSVAANHLTLPASGSAAQVQRAFSTTLQQVKLSSGRVAYRNTVAPTLAPSLAGAVQGVIGLNSLVRLKPMDLRPPQHRAALPLARRRRNVATGGPQPCAAAQAAATDVSTGPGYTSDQIAAAYDFSGLYGAGDLGAGQSVALFELEGNFPTDITAFEQCYGISTSVTYTPIDGGPSAPNITTSGGLETELDIDNVIGLAPGVTLDVYQAPNTNAGSIDEYSTIMSQDTSKVVSSSWGDCEPNVAQSDPTSVAAENSLFEEAALQGQTVIAASGDAGSAACSQGDTAPSASDDELAVGDPASQPFVTGVGGTSISGSNTIPQSTPILWTPGTPLYEGVWNSGTDPANGPGASTGGVSQFWPMPSYQSSANPTLGVGQGGSGAPCASSGFCREVPDVSADADPFYGYIIYYGDATGPGTGGWGSIGGTSGAAPLWAALSALENASAACHALTLGFLNPSLYAIAGTSAYGSDFRDILGANPLTAAASNDPLFDNSSSGSSIDPNPGVYPVKAGYDMTTGLGSPVAPALDASLCQARVPRYTVTVTGPGNRSAITGQRVSVAVHAADSGHVAVTYSATGLPSGLAINASTGVISGTPKAVQTTVVTVSAADTYANSGTTHFSFTVTKPGKPKTTAVKVSGVGKSKPRLSFTVNRGAGAPSLRSVAVSLPRGLSFDRNRKTVGRGIRLRDHGGKVRFTVSYKKGLLTIRFQSGQSTVSVQLTRPTISVSKHVAAQVRRRKLRSLRFGVRATDVKRATVKYSVLLKNIS